MVLYLWFNPSTTKQKQKQTKKHHLGSVGMPIGLIVRNITEIEVSKSPFYFKKKKNTQFQNKMMKVTMINCVLLSLD